MSERLTHVINVTALILTLYALAYFALARRGATVSFAGQWASLPDYRGVPESIFLPLHHWDRTVLRPQFWQGAIPLAEQLRVAKAAYASVFLSQP
jgi:hypothetical protein